MVKENRNEYLEKARHLHLRCYIDVCRIEHDCYGRWPALEGQRVSSSCHKDYNTIMPKKHPDVGKGEACLTCHAPDPAKNEPTKFSTEVHKVHQNGKTKQECSACHAL